MWSIWKKRDNIMYHTSKFADDLISAIKNSTITDGKLNKWAVLPLSGLLNSHGIEHIKISVEGFMFEMKSSSRDGRVEIAVRNENGYDRLVVEATAPPKELTQW